jgi:hypothetical protein
MVQWLNVDRARLNVDQPNVDRSNVDFYNVERRNVDRPNVDYGGMLNVFYNTGPVVQ